MALASSRSVRTDELSCEREEVSRVRRRDLAGVEDPRSRIDAAIALHLVGDHEQALEQLEPLTLQLDATAAEALWLASLCHIAQGRRDAAAGCLEVALLEISIGQLSRIAILYELGLVSESLGDLPRARAAFREVLQHAPWFRDTAAHAYALGA